MTQPRQGRRSASARVRLRTFETRTGNIPPIMPSAYANLLCHIVFSTKGRRPFLQVNLLPDMHRTLGGAVRDQKGKPVEIVGVADHVHMLVKLPPTIAIANFVRDIKANSSKWAHERPEVGRLFAWQVGYSAFTVSRSQAPRVRTYIQNQERHHKRKTFKEELLALLERNKIEYEERYLWDRGAPPPLPGLVRFFSRSQPGACAARLSLRRRSAAFSAAELRLGIPEYSGRAHRTFPEWGARDEGFLSVRERIENPF